MLLVWVVVFGLAMGTVSVGAGMRDDDGVTIRILEESAERTVIRYEFGDFRKRGISINGQTFTKIHLGGESLKKEKGAPALTDVSRSIIIPDDARMAVRVLDSSYYEIGDIDIVPSKGYILRTVKPADVPYTFGKAYETDAFYTGPLATLREPYIMRDYRGGMFQKGGSSNCIATRLRFSCKSSIRKTQPVRLISCISEQSLP